MMDRETETPADFSSERRRFLRRSLESLLGASTFLFSMMHARGLRALQLPKNTKWREGMRLLRDATAESNENVGFFVGDERSGTWIHNIEGGPFSVAGSHADLGAVLAHRADRHELKKGAAMYHTHVNSSTEARYRDFIARLSMRQGNKARAAENGHREQVKEYMATPSPIDVCTAADGFIEKYMAFANVEHAPLEHGVVTAKRVWTMNKINWNAANQKRYEKQHRFFVQRNTETARVSLLIREQLKSDAAFEALLSRLFATPEWEAVIPTKDVRIAFLADAMVSFGMGLPRQHLGSIFRTLHRTGVGDVLLDYWGDFSPFFVLGQVMEDDINAIHSGTMTFDSATARYANELRKFGLELAVKPH